MYATITQKTPQQLAFEAVDVIADDVLAYRIKRYNEGMAIFWFSKEATPQQIMSQYGVHGTEFLSRTGAEKAAILGLKPDAELSTAPADFRFEQDGSVTILSTLRVESIGGATVILTKNGQTIGTVTNPLTGNINADRVSTFSGLVEGTYSLSGSRDGFTIQPNTVTVTRNAIVSLSVTLITGVLTVTGPAGARIIILSGNEEADATNLDESGRFDFHLPPGPYTITSKLDGYVDTPVSIVLTTDGLTEACGLVPQQ